MNERLFLNGVSAVGFGDEEGENRFYSIAIGVPALGLIGGAVGGALIGNAIKKGSTGWIATGAAGGLVVGGATGVLVMQQIMQRSIDALESEETA